METVFFEALGAPVKGYLQDDYETLAAHKVRPALVICAGGAYRWLSPREKDPPAFAFLSIGYQVFLLEYSCGEGAGGYRPLRELAEAVCELRRRHEAWHIDPERIGVLGFSAGGHLAASLGALWNDPELGLPAASRPDALILSYPVISTGEFAHEESARWVSGGDPAVREKLHLWDRVTGISRLFSYGTAARTPVCRRRTVCIWRQLCGGRGYPLSIICLVPGGHGISTCTQEVETPDEVCRAWLPLCQTWLNRLFRYTP